jgi:hypothetical protein
MRYFSMDWGFLTRPKGGRRRTMIKPWILAEKIIAPCKAAGAGHFAATFNRTQPPQILKEWYVDYGQHVIPKLRRAAV